MNEQRILDFFQDKGGWFSKLPHPYEDLVSGHAHLFDDERLRWFLNEVDISGQLVVELGPLEGAHTYMLAEAGARQIVSIESNLAAYFKCLVVKEFYHLENVYVRFGDCLQWLPKQPRYGVCIASGILYHQTQPAELIAQIAQHCRCLYLWTHYYDPEHPALKSKHAEPDRCSTRGFDYTGYRIAYETFPHIGGAEPYARWMSREDLFRCLEHFGLHVEAVNFDEPDHPNGPALALIATKEDREWFQS